MIDVSVIIPVYNAETFLERAVQSAIVQKEVQEVLIVEDYSTDSSYNIALKLSSQYKKVRLLRNTRRVNLGAGASRNLGLRSSRTNFIAFLDADDFFVENRFAETTKIFETKYADAVYEVVGAHFYDEISKAEHIKRLEKARNPTQNFENTMLRVSASNSVFSSLVLGGKGWIHLDGLTIRRNVLDRVGGFSEHLRIGQDTDFIIKCAYHYNMLAGSFSNVVAKRGVHAENRILRAKPNQKFAVTNTIFKYFYGRKMDKKTGSYVTMRKVEAYSYYEKTRGLLRKVLKTFVLLYHFVRYPNVVKHFI